MAKRQVFSRDFKLEAVRLLDLGEGPAAQLARELGIRRDIQFTATGVRIGIVSSAFLHLETTVADKYWIDPRDKPGLLIAIIRELAGAGEISFEGWIGESRLPQIPGASFEETDALRRSTIVPKLDFAVLPLNADIVAAISRIVSEKGRLTDPTGIIHVQIALNGRLIFGGYDNFHRECVVAWEGFPVALLDRLTANGVIRSYETVPEDAHRWHD